MSGDRVEPWFAVLAAVLLTVKWLRMRRAARLRGER